ncbi:MAG: hypothetical protein ABI858_08105 [Pseudoxanthomonas sp.]
MTISYSAWDRGLIHFEGIGNSRMQAVKHPAVRMELPLAKRSPITGTDLITVRNAPLVRRRAST